MDKKHDKLMTDLQRLLETQDFKSEEEVRKFLDGFVGKQIPSFPTEALTPKEQAQDLVFAAYEMSPAKAKVNIEKALQFDPDCIEAYEFLGAMARTAELAIVHYEKGVSIGRRIFGGEYLEEHKGMFWGFHETRSFMRCLQHYAECLYIMGQTSACVGILEEMIVLNPNDNQGVRDQLLLYLIQLDEHNKYLKYAQLFKEDRRAFSLFNSALFTFKTEGETENAKKALLKALKQNKFVAKRLLSNKPITGLEEYYGIGDESEADYYASFAQAIWAETKGAREWLKKYATKS